MADVNVGSAGTLRVTAAVTAQSATGGWWDITWAAYLIERTPFSSRNLNGVSASVAIQGVGTVWSGSFTFDWRPAGLQTTVIASGTTRVSAPPNGSGAGLGDVTLNMGATGTGGAGGPASVTQALTLPTLVQPPDAPEDLSITRLSDTEIKLEWTPKPATGKPYTSQQIYVRVLGLPGTHVASLSATATTYTASTSRERKYEFYMYATNGAGVSPNAYFATVFTTPRELASLGAAVVSAGTIRLTLGPWTGSYDEAEVVIEETHDGGANWNLKDTLPVTDLSAFSITTWDDTSAETGGTVQYRATVRTTGGVQGTLTSASTYSNTLILNTPPNAPTGLIPTGNVDASRPVRLGWTHNPSSDGASQSSRKIEYSTDGGSTQTQIVAGNSTLAYYDWTPDTDAFMPGQTILWRVATAGSQPGTYGAWSDWQPLTLYGSLAVELVEDNPPEVHGGGPLPVAWTSSATWGTASQTQYRVTLTDNTNGQTVYDSGQVSSTAEAMSIPSNVQRDGRVYTLAVTLTDNHQIDSATVFLVITMDFLEPGPVEVTWTYDDETGQLVFYPEFSPETSSELDDTVAWLLERSTDGGNTWHQVTFTQSESAVSDPLPVLGAESMYRTTGYTALDIAGEHTEFTIPAEDVRSRWAWLNYGDDFDQWVRFGWAMTTDFQVGRPSVSNEIEGVEYPVPVWGDGAYERITINGKLLYGPNMPPTFASASDTEFREFAKYAARCMFRDGRGNWFPARVSEVRVAPAREKGNGQYEATVSFTIERVAELGQE